MTTPPQPCSPNTCADCAYALKTRELFRCTHHNGHQSTHLTPACSDFFSSLDYSVLTGQITLAQPLPNAPHYEIPPALPRTGETP